MMKITPVSTGAVARAIAAVWVPLAFLSVFVVAPLLLVAAVSLLREYPSDVLTATTANYRDLMRSFYAGYVLTTGGFGLAVAAITLVIGYPLAYYMTRRKGFEYQLILLSVVTPLLVGVVPRTVGWTILLGAEGAVNAALEAAGLIRQPLHLLYNPGAAIVGMVHVVLPFMVISISSALATINPTLYEAAESLGASRLRTFVRVTLPLSARGVAVGVALVFALGVGAYITPVVLGGGKLRLLAPLAYDQFVSIVNWTFGSAVSILLLTIGLLFVGILPLLVGWSIGRRRG